MPRLINQSNRDFWPDKIMDLANYVILTLVISQFVLEQIKWQAIAAGLALYAVLAIITYQLRKH